MISPELVWRVKQSLVASEGLPSMGICQFQILNSRLPFHAHDQVRSRDEDCAQIGSGHADFLLIFGLAVRSHHVAERRGAVRHVHVQEQSELLLPQLVWARTTRDKAAQQFGRIELMKLGLHLVGDDWQRWK